MRSEAVRTSNLSALLEILHLQGATSRSDLVSSTGLTRSAVGGLVGDLIEMGLVREERAAPAGRPGRPSPVVTPQGEQNAVVALEILVDSVAAAVIGLGGDVLAVQRVDRQPDEFPAERTIADLSDLANELIDTLPSTPQIHAVGVAVPGLVRGVDDHVVLAPNLQWSDVPVAELLRSSLGFETPIFVGNEADLAALAEAKRGVVAGVRNVLYLSGEVGVGGGVIVDGTILQGTSGFAGEIGHVPVNIDGVECNCGAVGCFETEVGEEALLRRAGRAHEGGRSEIRRLVDEAATGSDSVLAAFEEHGRWLGFGLAGLVNVLNPSAVVFGGFLGPAMPYLRRTVEAELERRLLDPIRLDSLLFESALGPDAPLLGAGELAWARSIEVLAQGQ